VFLFVCTPAAAFPPPAPDKKVPKIAGWGEVIDPDADCKVTEEKGVLTIVVPKTHHDLTYQEDGTKRNGPRVLQSVNDDFTFKVTVKGTATPKNVTSSSGKYTYVSSGVVIWFDEKNFARMERGAICHSGAAGTGPYTHVELFTEGKSVRGKRVELGETDTGMRVTRKGKQFTFEVDPGNEGKKWTAVFDGEYAVPSNLKIGVLALNTTAVEYAPQFAGLELKETK
jgi:regulation of enolase protein 1 (concanavalin A-like superfamily)